MAAAVHILAREQSEKLLHESEHRFRSLTDLSNDWYWEQDENLRFTFLSSKFYEKSGLTATSTIGKTRWETADIVPLSGTWAEHQATLDAREPFRDFEYRRIGEDGRIRVFGTSGEPFFDATGKFGGYRGIGRDITDRKLAAEATRESQENLSAAQHLAHIGIWELDIGEPRDLDKYPLQWSDETFRIFGYEPREIDASNENFFKAVHPDDRARIRDEVATAVSDCTNHSIEHRIIRPDGSERIVQEMSVIVYDPITSKPVIGRG